MSAKAIRVLSLPGRNFRGGNPFFRKYCESLSSAGVDIVDIKSIAALTLQFDLINVHFPEHYVTEQSFFGALKWTSFYLSLFVLSKLTGRRIVWLVHDVHPFKMRHVWLLRPYMSLFRRLVDAHIFLSPSSREEFYEAFPSQRGKPDWLMAHPPFSVTDISGAEVRREREALGLEGAFVVGFLGDVKEYKNVGALAAVPSLLPDGRAVKLIVAGKPDAQSAAVRRAVLGRLSPAMLVDSESRLSAHRLDLLIRCCDCVLLPYAKGWNSGFAMLVLSNFRRVIGSLLPVFADLRDMVGPGWVRQSAFEGDLPGVLQQFADEPIDDASVRALDGKLQSVSFHNCAVGLVTFFDDLERARLRRRR